MRLNLCSAVFIVRYATRSVSSGQLDRAAEGPYAEDRMASRLGALVVIVTAALASSSCGSTPQVSGDWSGGVRPLHLDILQIRLTREGKTIRGTACYVIGNGVPPTVVFRDAVVTGRYPAISVVASNGWSFEGEFQDDDTLSGRYHTPTEPGGYAMDLARGVGPGASCVTP